jgi:hypothetical protein
MKGEELEDEDDAEGSGSRRGIHDDALGTTQKKKSR